MEVQTAMKIQVIIMAVEMVTKILEAGMVQVMVTEIKELKTETAMEMPT